MMLNKRNQSVLCFSNPDKSFKSLLPWQWLSLVAHCLIPSCHLFPWSVLRAAAESVAAQGPSVPAACTLQSAQLGSYPWQTLEGKPWKWKRHWVNTGFTLSATAQMETLMPFHHCSACKQIHKTQKLRSGWQQSKISERHWVHHIKTQTWWFVAKNRTHRLTGIPSLHHADSASVTFPSVKEDLCLCKKKYLQMKSQTGCR